MDTKLKKSIAFHPQIDGQTEVVNKTIVHLLRAYCSKHHKLWDEHLHYIQHAYNWAKHSSTNTSPFEACFGYLPKSPLDLIIEKDVAIDGHSDIDKARMFIERIQLIHQWVQEQLEKVKATTRRGMTNTELIISFKKEMTYGRILVRKECKEKVKS